MPSVHHPRLAGAGISDSAEGIEEALDRPYRYRGPDSEPNPSVIAARVHAEVLRRNPDLAALEAAGE